MAEESKHRRVFRCGPGSPPEVEGDASEIPPEPRPPRGSRDGPDPAPAMSFTTHVVSLNMAALLQLGVIEDEAGARRDNPEAARLLIDTLAMLREKTRGNLDAAEANLLNAFLYELRLKYLEVKRG